MAEGSAFDKRHVEESEMKDMVGLLDQLNMPPAFVKFVRKNKRFVQALTAVLIIGVVVWALYGSYREKKIENAASALSSAMQSEGQDRLEALGVTESTYSGTTSALWAKIASAHELAKNDQAEEAKQKYIEARAEVGKSSPLLPLLAVGIAQTSEILGQYQEASVEYEYLKTTKGFEDLAFSGLAGIQEIQGNKDNALKIYEQYLATLQDGVSGVQKTLVEEKIARLRASL